jgi:hypothetical protein
VSWHHPVRVKGAAISSSRRPAVWDRGGRFSRSADFLGRSADFLGRSGNGAAAAGDDREGGRHDGGQREAAHPGPVETVPEYLID